MAEPTANAVFKSKYRKYFDVALLVSLGIHLISFAFMPQIDINPTKTDQEEIDVIDIPPEIDIPPPPKAIERPKIPIESLDEDVEEEESIEDTDFNPDNMNNAPPPPPPGGGGFESFEKAPKPKRIVLPEHPKIARQAEIEGTVLLRVTIDEHGRTVSATVIRSDSELLNQAAINAMMQWTWEPAEQSGSPVRSVIAVPIEMLLNR